jgi:uncharacterized protein (TIGR03435 family)
MNTIAGVAMAFMLSAQVRQFDVATVKVNREAPGGSLIRTPGSLTATDTEFAKLIEMAFQTRLLDLSGVPQSLRIARFDIVAKASGTISGDQYWDMLRGLLRQRFNLKYHTEVKRSPLYRLTRLKSTTTLGPKITRSDNPECPANPTVNDFCGVSAQPGYMNGKRVTMARLARELSAFTDRPVRDETSLSGSFDFQLRWTPDESVTGDGRVKLLNGNGNPLNADEPSIYIAAREQLGLKLEPGNGQIEVLVIDHAEQPDLN